MWWNRLSTQNSGANIEQFVNQLQNEIILAHNKSQQVSLTAFSQIAQQLQQILQLVQRKDTEIKRLQGLCEKNKIEYKPKESK